MEDEGGREGDALRVVLAYHERSKHHPSRYARSLGFMDWANQPDPFRRFEGARLVALAQGRDDDGPGYDSLLAAERRVEPASLDADSIARLFFDSLALSAWKAAGGTRWALRVNPSSGNLHPTEGYLLCGPIEGLCELPGLWHYAPERHGLELRRELSADAWRALRAESPYDLFVALTSIHWREAWKYGERAYRYCQHDAGHAIGALALGCAILGWRCELVESCSDPGTTPAGAEPARRIVRRRRSAVRMDGRTALGRRAFYGMLSRLMPLERHPLWSAWPWPACIDLALFVHRVKGLPSGLYWLQRGARPLDEMAAEMRSSFAWTRPEECPDDLPLRLLEAGDVRTLAAQIPCQQTIAGDGVFAAAMIADFAGSLESRGAWFYRRLFWETGMLGQLLYLEAEAAGIRGTGIGCFFDDAMHESLGLRGNDRQSLYHFTVGGPIEDERIQTLAAYGHLEDRGR